MAGLDLDPVHFEARTGLERARFLHHAATLMWRRIQRPAKSRSGAARKGVKSAELRRMR